MAVLSHDKIERNSVLLLVLILIVVSIGGLIEIAPLFYLESTIEKVKGMRPYTPLELAGRNIYIREGCYVCHSQMIRSLRDEQERYGHYSLAAESMYDHPFQWGSKRTGPDLARVAPTQFGQLFRDVSPGEIPEIRNTHSIARSGYPASALMRVSLSSDIAASSLPSFTIHACDS